MTEIREVPRVIVQTNTALGVDSTWVTLDLVRFISGSEGAGQIAGEAILEQVYGLTTFPNQPDPVYDVGTAPTLGSPVPDDTLVGQLIRLLVSDYAGTIAVNGQQWTAFWYGQCMGFSLIPDNRGDLMAGGTARWTCAGIASLLDQITILGGFTVPPSADSVPYVDPGFCPPFNAVPTGDRSTATYQVNGVSCYIHDLNTLAQTDAWRATDVITLLLAGVAQTTYADTAPVGIPWALNDPDSLLDYVIERTDVNGRTLAEAINQIINPRRGLIWNVTVSNGTAYVNVYSGTDTSITVGSFTLPASTNTVGYVAAGNPFTSALSIDEDQSATYDIIEIRGARPWVGITLDYSATGTPALMKGWQPSSESSWDSDPGAAQYEDIWRLFKLNPQWDGSQYGNDTYGMRNNLTENGPGGGYDGGREVDLGDDANPIAALYAMERQLPASYVFGSNRLGPRQLPLIIVGSGTSGGWEDFSNTIIGSGNWGIDCQTSPPIIRIDDGLSGKTLSGLVEAGTMLVTVGMRETQPLRVSYVFPQGSWPRITPRIKMIDVPHLEQWVVLPETVTGIDESGNLQTNASMITIRDDTDIAQQLLALAVARYGYPIVNASWTEQCLLDTSDDFAPGTLLSVITAGNGDIYVGSVITRRSWRRLVRDGVNQWDTSYSTTRVVPDVETIW